MKAQLAAYGLRAVRRAERIRLPSGPALAYSVAALVVIGFLMTGANLLFTAAYVNRANHTWCQTLDLLTSKPVHRPVDPAANPSREQAYHLYSVFVTQRHRLGCG